MSSSSSSSSSSSTPVKHVRRSRVKYAPGTIVTTETGRRAQVQADGRWRWLPKLVSDLKEASKAALADLAGDSCENNPPPKKRKTYKPREAKEVKRPAISADNTQRVTKRKRKSPSPPAIDAFSAEAAKEDKPKKQKKKDKSSGWFGGLF